MVRSATVHATTVKSKSATAGKPNEQICVSIDTEFCMSVLDTVLKYLLNLSRSTLPFEVILNKNIRNIVPFTPIHFIIIVNDFYCLRKKPLYILNIKLTPKMFICDFVLS